ncbi:MAG: M56 family metallopeptidase [Gemmatimonadota bacterium]
MIGAAMLYGWVISALILMTAWVIERFLQVQGVQTRRVWLAALAGTVLIPGTAMVWKDAPPAFELDGEIVPTSQAAGVMMDGVATLASLDALLLTGWVVASIALLLYFAGGFAISAWRSRAWTPTEIDGVEVLLTEDVGPAVIGFRSPRVVLPRWTLTLPAAERAMMLRHECEHRDARDPMLVATAILFVVAMPWNAPVWVMARRLQLAVEVDCDRRVVDDGAHDLRRYAELLLAVGARRVPAMGMGFSVGKPFLEQRIDRMTLPTRRQRRSYVVALMVGVLGVLGAAWSIPQPVRAMKVGHQVDYWCPDYESDVSQRLLESLDRAT